MVIYTEDILLDLFRTSGESIRVDSARIDNLLRECLS
jgi:hypothetical protein